MAGTFRRPVRNWTPNDLRVSQARFYALELIARKMGRSAQSLLDSQIDVLFRQHAMLLDPGASLAEACDHCKAGAPPQAARFPCAARSASGSRVIAQRARGRCRWSTRGPRRPPMLSRRLSSLLLMSALVAGLFAGCRTLGESISDTPLSLVPNTQEFLAQRGVTSNPTTSVATGGAPGGMVAAPATYTTQLGVVLALSCPPDVVNCDPTVFKCQADAQAFFVALAQATGLTDCANLDGGAGNGQACDGGALPASCN